MIQFVHVTKTFPTGNTALSDVTFSVEPGEFVFFVGESGAGKTTLMKLLTRDLLPTEGEDFVSEKNLAEMKSKELPFLRRDVAVVFQDYKLLPEKTVAENIGLALDIVGKEQEEIEGRIDDLLKLVGLEDKRGFFPRQLSGGEAQKVSIARALAIGPKVLFADEPTGNLDPASGMTIAKLFEKIHELGTTVLMATHNMDIVKTLKKREIHLHKGKIIKDSGQKEEKKKKQEKEHG